MAKTSKTSSTAQAEPDRREAIIAAYMALLADKPPNRIGYEEIAARAGVSLAALRSEFDSAFSILAAFVADIDEAVLAGIDKDLADQDTRERLFDVLMRRLDLLAPHKAAIRSLSRAAAADPGLALAINRLAVRSQRWMLAAAGVETAGPGGGIRAQGMAVAFARIVRAWLDDEDPALARTMRVMDEQLKRAGRAAGFLRAFEQLTAPLRALACAPASLCSRSWPRDRWRDRDRQNDGEDGPRGEGWRGDDFRDPKVTPA
ncbi:TetR/AcrR family transcriptional regulator [Phreatobacter sp.]|uniref:TetR/AcrR family transcriptional regulator n=1 Tax=Phreatobacter sp. TaxID=1966341 RepID=UPI003F708F23